MPSRSFRETHQGKYTSRLDGDPCPCPPELDGNPWPCLPGLDSDPWYTSPSGLDSDPWHSLEPLEPTLKDIEITTVL